MVRASIIRLSNLAVGRRGTRSPPKLVCAVTVTGFLSSMAVPVKVTKATSVPDVLATSTLIFTRFFPLGILISAPR